MSTVEGTQVATEQGSIRLEGLAKYYGDLCVFRDIDLEIRPREIVSIVGPSGCGKTTLLRCINGLVQPDEGDVIVDGEPITGPRQSVAMVFQDFGLFPWKTVMGNAGYGLMVRGNPKSRVEAAAQRFIDMVGLRGRESAYPFQLSGGMQQRVGLARALAVEPRVMLMDEPFGALDAQTRELLQYEMLNIWEAHPVTMVFVTHSIEEAVLMGDRIIVMMGSPSRIHEIVDVPIPRPRDAETVASPEFQNLRRHVWNLVMGSDRVVREAPHVDE